MHTVVCGTHIRVWKSAERRNRTTRMQGAARTHPATITCRESVSLSLETRALDALLSLLETRHHPRHTTLDRQSNERTSVCSWPDWPVVYVRMGPRVWDLGRHRHSLGPHRRAPPRASGERRALTVDGERMLPDSLANADPGPRLSASELGNGCEVEAE